jgi:hypothetical protein
MRMGCSVSETYRRQNNESARKSETVSFSTAPIHGKLWRQNFESSHLLLASYNGRYETAVDNDAENNESPNRAKLNQF